MVRVATHESVIVIGNGMASHAFCNALVQGPAAERPRLTVIGEEPQPAYNRVRLSELWDGLSAGSLELASRSWYAEHGICLLTGERVAAIDRETRQVRTDQGRVLEYDRLVLATGSSALRPPVPGLDDPACFVYRSVEDLAGLQRAAAQARRCVVLGGGLLGLEVAKPLHDAGLEVHVLEAADGPMLRQLDLESARCLHDRIERLGVSVHVKTRLTAVERAPDGLQLRLETGAAIATDMVVIAVGVKPRDELALQAGLACSVRGGVIVDDRLATSDPRIFAIGECASYHGQSVGLFGPCQQMARALAASFQGQPAAFAQPDLTCRLKLLGVEVAAVGDYAKEHRALAKSVEGGRRTLLLDEDRVVAAIAVGSWPELPQIERMIAQRTRLTRRQLARFAELGRLSERSASLPVSAWPDAALACNCARVTVGELRMQLAGGVFDPVLIAARTGATAGCGSCKPLLGELLGNPQLMATQGRSFGLPWLSLLAGCAVLAIGLLAPIPFATSVADASRAVDQLWRETSNKQLSGFAILGLSALGFMLSLRKRARWWKLGQLNLYRSLHGALGLSALVAVLAHTGLRVGHNLNFALMSCFLALNLLGAALGLVASLEMKSAHPLAAPARALRPYLTLLHIVLVWPLPVLVGLHVLATYYF